MSHFKPLHPESIEYNTPTRAFMMNSYVCVEKEKGWIRPDLYNVYIHCLVLRLRRSIGDVYIIIICNYFDLTDDFAVLCYVDYHGMPPLFKGSPIYHMLNYLMVEDNNGCIQYIKHPCEDRYEEWMELPSYKDFRMNREKCLMLLKSYGYIEDPFDEAV